MSLWQQVLHEGKAKPIAQAQGILIQCECIQPWLCQAQYWSVVCLIHAQV